MSKLTIVGTEPKYHEKTQSSNKVAPVNEKKPDKISPTNSSRGRGFTNTRPRSTTHTKTYTTAVAVPSQQAPGARSNFLPGRNLDRINLKIKSQV